MFFPRDSSWQTTEPFPPHTQESAQLELRVVSIPKQEQRLDASPSFLLLESGDQKGSLLLLCQLHFAKLQDHGHLQVLLMAGLLIGS